MDVTACFFHGHHTHTKGLVKPFLTCGLYVADKVLIMQCMVMFLRLFPSVKYSCLHWVLVACVFSATQVFAGNYPLGDMTCPQIGQFASTAMQWREDGVTPEEALQRLENMRPAESVEKKNLRMVLSLVYGGYGDGWTVKSAAEAMRIDCQTGR